MTHYTFEAQEAKIGELHKKINNLKKYISQLVPECENCYWLDNYNVGWDCNMCDGCEIIKCNWKHK